MRVNRERKAALLDIHLDHMKGRLFGGWGFAVNRSIRFQLLNQQRPQCDLLSRGLYRHRSIIFFRVAVVPTPKAKDLASDINNSSGVGSRRANIWRRLRRHKKMLSGFIPSLFVLNLTYALQLNEACFKLESNKTASIRFLVSAQQENQNVNKQQDGFSR